MLFLHSFWMQGFASDVGCFAFSPDGDWLATAGGKETEAYQNAEGIHEEYESKAMETHRIQIWNLHSRKCEALLQVRGVYDLGKLSTVGRRLQDALDVLDISPVHDSEPCTPAL